MVDEQKQDIILEGETNYKIFTFYDKYTQYLIRNASDKKINDKGICYDDILIKYENNNEKDTCWVDCIDKAGKFHIEYKRLTNGFLGKQYKFDRSSTKASFYENEKLLFQKIVSGNTIILYGDGVTKEETYYSTHVAEKIVIYNLKGEIIRTTSIGASSPIEFRKAGHYYAITSTFDCYSGNISLGIVNLNTFFNPEEHDEKTAPYDNSHIGLDHDNSIIPVEVTPEGFILKYPDNWEKDIPFLKWDDVETFDFESNRTEEKQTKYTSKRI